MAIITICNAIKELVNTYPTYF